MDQSTSAPNARRAVALVGVPLIGVALVAVASLYGRHLFGVGGGVLYAIVTAGVVWLLARSVARGKGAIVQTILLFAGAIVAGAMLAFPASFNWKVQHAINSQATERNARTELNQVFGSDAAFAQLSISMTQLKILNISITGALASRADLDRLHERILKECPTLDNCIVRWDVQLRETQERVEGLDRDVFPAIDDSV